MTRPISNTILSKISRWLGINNETRYTIYLATIEGNRLANVSYWLELFLACSIATLGLILNSPAIIIGAMLISPLMTPIMGTGLALATGDLFLGIRALQNLGLSILIALAISIFFVTVLPFKESTSEILVRTQPTLLDLVVALLCGLAGSVATLKSSKGITAALPGTAIAVALLPPLCVVGFGIGIRKFDPQWIMIAKGGGLLFAANMVAIVLTSMLVFLSVGMGRKKIRVRVDEWRNDPERLSRLETFLLNRSHIGQLFKKVGSVQARVIVILAFFFVIYFPLQEAMSRVIAQVSQNTKKQAQVKIINQEAKKIFRISNRSDIEKISIENNPEGVQAVVRVSTNKLFNKEDKIVFENQITKKIGEPVHLVLIQSPGFFGGEKETDWTKLFSDKTKAVPPQSLTETYSLMFGRIETAVHNLWPSSQGKILNLQFQLVENELGNVTPTLQLTYLGAKNLGEDAKAIFGLGIKQTLSIEPKIIWNWVPSKYGPFPVKSYRKVLSSDVKQQLIEISSALKKYPEIAAEIQFILPSRFRLRRKQTPNSLMINEVQEFGIPSDQSVFRELTAGPPRIFLSLELKAKSPTVESLPSPTPSPTPSPK